MKNSSIFNSIKWSGIEKMSQFAVQFIVTVILARILGPEEYAVIGILNIFIAISSVLVDSGFSQGLIKKTDCKECDFDTIFWFNFGVSILLYILLYVTAPCIADYFNNDTLLWTSRILFLVIPIQALNVIQSTIVNKYLNFRKIAFVAVVGSSVSGIISIIFALLGFGIWALIIQALFFQIVSVIMYWLTSTWHPKFQFNKTSFSELFPFSIKLAGASFINVVFNNLYSLSIAKFYPAISFGFYSQAQRFATVPTNIIEAVMNRVTYPTLSLIQDNKEDYESTFWNIQRSVFAFVAPLMICLALCGYEVLVLLLGFKWLDSVGVFRILCLAGITIPLHPIVLSVLKIANKSGIILKTEILKKGLLILAIIISIKHGIIGLAWSQVVYLWSCLFINMIYVSKCLSLSFYLWLFQIFKYLIIAIIPAIPCVFVFLYIDSDSIFYALLIKMSLFLFFYVLLLRAFKLPEYNKMKLFFINKHRKVCYDNK